MVTLPTYHICLICTAIESPYQGGILHQGADKAYVILLPEATHVSKNGLFALLITGADRIAFRIKVCFWEIYVLFPKIRRLARSVIVRVIAVVYTLEPVRIVSQIVCKKILRGNSTK